jgi:hypothetical protein
VNVKFFVINKKKKCCGITEDHSFEVVYEDQDYLTEL